MTEPYIIDIAQDIHKVYAFWNIIMFRDGVNWYRKRESRSLDEKARPPLIFFIILLNTSSLGFFLIVFPPKIFYMLCPQQLHSLFLSTFIALEKLEEFRVTCSIHSFGKSKRGTCFVVALHCNQNTISSTEHYNHYHHHNQKKR